MFINLYFIVVLQWFVDPDIADAALFQKKLIQEYSVEVQPNKITASCVDEKVCMNSCKKYFSDDAWMAVMNVVSTIENNPMWYCGFCTKEIDDKAENSIQCDSCLVWFHFVCVKMIRAPKQKTWFCTSCR